MPRTDLPQVRRAFDLELALRGWNAADLHRAILAASDEPMDRGTVEEAVNGTRWPNRKNRPRIELALGWGIGWMQDIRDGVSLETLKTARGDMPPPALRDPTTHSLADATDAELQAEIARRQAMTGTVASR